jgi:phosphatidylethanolamine/phosphatidyl-N-methylethanolamine N-methyltransferase
MTTSGPAVEVEQDSPVRDEEFSAMGGKPARIRDHLLFLSKFFRQGRRIASIWPSSRAMAMASLRQVQWDCAQVIVELGAGTGPITEQISRRLPSRSRLISIERDRDFVHILRSRFSASPGVTIVHGDVSNLGDILRTQGLVRRHVDYFISGLATPSLPDATRTDMFKAIVQYLHPQGTFSNITEIPWYYLGYYRRFFHEVSFQLVPMNVPPGGVYHCRTPRRDIETNTAAQDRRKLSPWRRGERPRRHENR